MVPTALSELLLVSRWSVIVQMVCQGTLPLGNVIATSSLPLSLSINL